MKYRTITFFLYDMEDTYEKIKEEIYHLFECDGIS